MKWSSSSVIVFTLLEEPLCQFEPAQRFSSNKQCFIYCSWLLIGEYMWRARTGTFAFNSFPPKQTDLIPLPRSVRLTVFFCVLLWSGMPQTVCSGTMFTTPSGFSPHLACAEPGGEEEEEAPQEGPEPGACLADGPPITSASLDTLIQNLVPTADYYPEVNELDWTIINKPWKEMIWLKFQWFKINNKKNEK